LLPIDQTKTDNKNIQGTQKLNSPKTDDPIKKWTTELNRIEEKDSLETGL
jgi:hypothetical protein